MDDELAFASNGQGASLVGNVPCVICGARTAMCCSACEAVFYCSAACQQRDWKDHWKVCGTQQAPPAVSDVASPLRSPGGRLPGRSPTGRPESDDGEGFEVALPQSNFASAAAAQAAATSAARDRRLRLRVSAVLAAREGRHQDALQHAAEAYEVAQRLGSLHVEGRSLADEGGIAELEGPALVELVIIVRAALALNDFGTGLGFLEMLTATTDRLAGVGGNPAMLHPTEAASLLCATSELCALYNHEERAEDYAHAYLGVARLAHGEGSKEVGDAHAYLCGLFTRRKRYQEAILHAASTLKIRQRHASYGAEKPVADAYWNLAVLQYQLGQHRAALDSLEACREVHARISGEGVATSNADVALGQVWTILGEATRAMRSYRQAVRWRQRTLGFAHAETRRAAGLLAAAEIEAHAEEEWKKDVEAEAADASLEPLARPRPRQRPQEGPPADRGPPLPPPASPGKAKYVDPKALIYFDPVNQVGSPRDPRPPEAPLQSFEPDKINFERGGSKLSKDTQQMPAGYAQPKKQGIIECTAETEDQPLGMTPGNAPPGQVFLKTVVPGSWADRNGLQPGMELLTVNGVMVKNMNAQDFKSELRQMPVTVTLAKKPGRAASGGANSSYLLMEPQRSETDADPLTFVVPDTAKTVGCLFTSVPPGRVFIRKVEQGSWADQIGVEVGWELFSLNNQQCEVMDADDFRSSMRSRPLTLTFYAADGAKARGSKMLHNMSSGVPGSRFDSETTAATTIAESDPQLSRNEIIKQMFQEVDVSKTGRLKRREMWLIAQQMGWEGRSQDGESAFQDEYEVVCEDAAVDAEVGFDLKQFSFMLNNKSGDYYRDDDELMTCLEGLQDAMGR